MKKNHRYILIPCLDYKMKQAGANNMLLAAAAGVGAGTVNKARNGVKIRLRLGLCILEAINNRPFQRGRKGPHKWDENRRKKTA